MSAAARLPDLIVEQASDAPKRFDPLAAPFGDLSYLRSPDGWNRRQADIQNNDGGRRSRTNSRY
jgi:hypothetical protein